MNENFSKSPFLEMKSGWRVLVIAYVFIYRIFLPLAAAIGNPDCHPMLAERFIVHAIYEILLIMPLVYYRREFGFLHPLILPLLLSIFQMVAQNPLSIFLPADFSVVSYVVDTHSRAATLRIDTQALAVARFWLDLSKVIGVLAYYLGYYKLPIFKVPALQFQRPRNVGAICFAWTVACIAVGLAFIQLQSGGLASHLIAMRSGRAVMFEGQGQFLTIAEFSIVCVLVWFSYSSRLFTNPVWLACFAASSFTTLVISGSRSSLIFALVVFLLLWWRKRGRVLILPAAIMGVIAVLVIGVFGSIRQDFHSTSVDTSVFKVENLSQNLDRASAEFQKRDSEEGDLAAFVGAKNELLLGRSYVAGAAFFVPRAIWPTKPRGAGAYNMWVNFANQPLDSFGQGGIFWGIPMSPTTEAYWNFHIVGVILVMGLFGAFHRWLSDFVCRYPTEPIPLLFAVWMTTHFFGDPNSFISAMRDALLLGVLSMTLGIFKLGNLAIPARIRRGSPA
jgi:hypothetical protein